MSDIEEFQRRITGALERAGQAIDQLSTAPTEGGDTAALSAELEAERTANAQLEERVRAIKEKQETTLARLEKEVAELRESVQTRDAEVQRLASVNADLRSSNTALRDANAKGVGDADAVNASMASELESLRAQQANDRSEIDEILSTLDEALKEA